MEEGKGAKRPHKRCPVCGRRVRALFDGSVRVHYEEQSSYVAGEWEGKKCPGSGGMATAELRRERIGRR